MQMLMGELTSGQFWGVWESREAARRAKDGIEVQVTARIVLSGHLAKFDVVIAQAEARVAR